MNKSLIAIMGAALLTSSVAFAGPSTSDNWFEGFFGKYYQDLNLNDTQKTQLRDIHEKHRLAEDKNKLYGERERLMRYYERLKTEVQTYENNIGFLSVSSKGGSGLVKEMERKIENLKEEMALTVKKIDAIDENLE